MFVIYKKIKAIIVAPLTHKMVLSITVWIALVPCSIPSRLDKKGWVSWEVERISSDVEVRLNFIKINLAF